MTRCSDFCAQMALMVDELQEQEKQGSTKSRTADQDRERKYELMYKAEHAEKLKLLEICDQLLTQAEQTKLKMSG